MSRRFDLTLIEDCHDGFRLESIIGGEAISFSARTLQKVISLFAKEYELTGQEETDYRLSADPKGPIGRCLVRAKKGEIPPPMPPVRYILALDEFRFVTQEDWDGVEPCLRLVRDLTKFVEEGKDAFSAAASIYYGKKKT